MSALIFIGLTYMFSYNCSENYKVFRGASANAKGFIGLMSHIGIVVFYATLIWSFWHFAWWQPIVTYIGAMLVSGFTAFLFQGNAFGIIASPFLVIVYSFLSVFSLL